MTTQVMISKYLISTDICRKNNLDLSLSRVIGHSHIVYLGLLVHLSQCLISI
jgi:hypothetical protein